ncbi:MAG: hypothetical protein ACXVCV_07810 [Polyangia bacterium]
MRYLGAFLLCFTVGCGATNPSHGGGSGGTGGGGTGGTGGGGTGGTGGGGTGGSGGGTGTDGCTDAAKLIYTIDQDGTFSSFKPDQMNINNSVFTNIGKLACNAGGLYQPFSMSVDRSANAWVEYVDQSGIGKNKLFKVSTADASCTATAFTGNQQGFNEFGMGFVSNASGSTDETLFIAGGGTVGGASSLGTLDMTSFMITKGGALTGDPELTGTGLAELWGFFPDLTMNTSQAHVAKIDKTSGTESNPISLGSAAGMAQAWAFAFYGGEFFVFLAKQGGATTVYHVTMTGVKDQLDTGSRHIVGAGVSTCAPTTPIG